MTALQWAMIGLSVVLTFLLRALPFLIFSGERKMPPWLDRLGKALPAAIMAVLLVYCLRDAGSDWLRVGLPKLLAVGVTAAVYKWRHNTFAGILSGTAAYMLLLRIL